MSGRIHAQRPAPGAINREPEGSRLPFRPSFGNNHPIAARPSSPSLHHNLSSIPVSAPTPSHDRSASITGGNQPIQRTISLHGEDDAKDANLTRLNNLLGNSGARLKRSGANVEFDAHPSTPEGAEHPSYRLLSRMMAHRHDVKIGTHPAKGAADPSTAPGSDVDAFDPAKGSHAFVHLPPVIGRGAVTTFDPKSNQFLTEDSPDHLQLGHELIHADHIQRGTASHPDQQVELPVAGTLHGFGDFSTTMKEKREELVTIGRVPGKEGDDIHENHLRRALGMRPRVAHNQVESQLVKDHEKQLADLKGKFDTHASAIAGHEDGMRRARDAGQAASARAAEARRKAETKRGHAELERPFAEGLRGGGEVIPGVPWAMLADAHAENMQRHLAEAAAHEETARKHDEEEAAHRATFEAHGKQRAEAHETSAKLREEYSGIARRREELRSRIVP